MAMDLSNIPDLGSRQLLAVLAIADYGSFIAAAAFLKTSQPALTRTIKRIEDVLGMSLFERTTRRVQLTPAGREFIAVAERVLNDLRISVRGMRELADQQRGQVILASIIASNQLPRIVAEYHIAKPAIELHVREGVHGAVLDDVRSGIADLGITYTDELPDTVAMVPLGREVLHAVLPRQHRLARLRRVTLKQIAREPLVSLPTDSRTRRLIDAAASRQGITLQRAVIANQVATVMSLVRAGLGVAIMLEGAIAGFNTDGLATLPITGPTLSLNLGLVTLKEREPTPAARGIAMLIRSVWSTTRGLMPEQKYSLISLFSIA
jgi:DNA-binding transcriptional LysR family regulator